MMNTKSWEKVEQGVFLLSGVAVGAFWLILTKFELMGIVMAAYMSWFAYAGYKRDRADEREALIAARAGYLSHKLTIAMAALLFALTLRAPARALDGLLVLLLLGPLCETAFRYLQGGQKTEAAPAWLWALIAVCFLVFAWGIFAVFSNIAESFGMSLWDLAKLIYHGSPK